MGLAPLLASNLILLSWTRDTDTPPRLASFTPGLFSSVIIGFFAAIDNIRKSRV
jgi:hypothetical protein